jgi:hypothetical protein
MPQHKRPTMRVMIEFEPPSGASFADIRETPSHQTSEDNQGGQLMPDNKNYPVCSRCQTWLFNEIELDTGVCENCADKLYERYKQRQEWEYYHPSDPEERNPGPSPNLNRRSSK